MNKIYTKNITQKQTTFIQLLAPDLGKADTIVARLN